MGNCNSFIFRGANSRNTKISKLPSDLHDLATNPNFRYVERDSLKIPIYISESKRAKVYVIYCHANGEVMNEQLIRTMSSLLKMLDTPLNMVFFEYPGYGLMLGQANTKNCYSTLVSAIQYVHSINTHHYPIILYGRSIGAAFASRYCAEHEDVDGIILESPFSEIHHVIRGCCCCFRCCTPNIKCAEYLSSIQIPKLLIYGTRDPLNPPQTQQELLSYFTSDKDQILALMNFSHNNIPFGTRKQKIVCYVPRTCCCAIVPKTSTQYKRYIEAIKEYVHVIIDMNDLESVEIIGLPDLNVEEESEFVTKENGLIQSMEKEGGETGQTKEEEERIEAYSEAIEE